MDFHAGIFTGYWNRPWHIANVLIYQRGRGIVLREPSVVAVNKQSPKNCAQPAKKRARCWGARPAPLWRMQPIRDGVIADYTVTEQMLKHFIQKRGRQADVLQAARHHLRAERSHQCRAPRRA
jgi:actin-like ATPase involved in cell morphogenesis